MRRQATWIMAAIAAVMLGACGNGGSDGATTTAAEDEDDRRGPHPCALLSAAQIATVLPGAKEGYEAMRGGSLVKGIDSYQCSYADADMNMLLVMFHTAATDELFEDIKPKNPAWIVGDDNVQRVDLGDGGWLRRSDSDLKLTASRGHLVIELSLDAPDRKEKEGALTALGQALLDTLRTQAQPAPA